MIEIKKIHQFNVFCVNSLAQETIATYLNHVDVSQLAGFYKNKRDYFKELLTSSSFEVLPCEGTYFQNVSYKNISDNNDISFCETLIKNHGVAAIPLSVFYKNGQDNKTIRLCFAKDNVTLINAAEKLCKI